MIEWIDAFYEENDFGETKTSFQSMGKAWAHVLYDINSSSEKYAKSPKNKFKTI